MARETLWTRLRQVLAALLGRTRGARRHETQPAVADARVPAAAAAPAPAAAPTPAPAPRPAPPPTPPPVAAAVEPRPGRFETDTDLGMQAGLYDAPHKRRAFLIYLPAAWSSEARAPLVVLCHGCKQTPEEFAEGTRFAALADRLGCLVLMPRQTKWANPWRCWKWYDPAITADGGEAALIAAQIRFVRQRYRADPRRVIAVGMSAGAAMAAALGLRYPRHVHAVVAHAGVAYGAAASALAAAEVMSRGPQTDVAALGRQARARFGGVRPVPLLAIHGDSDAVVAPANSAALVCQYLHFNAHPAAKETAVAAEAGAGSTEMPDADSTASVTTEDGREVTTREWRIDGRLIVRYVAIAGLGHAWSGGDQRLAFNDARAPDASKLVGEFLAEVLPAAGAAV